MLTESAHRLYPQYPIRHYVHIFSPLLLYLADPGKARGLSTNILVIIESVSEPFPATALQRRHAQTI